TPPTGPIGQQCIVNGDFSKPEIASAPSNTSDPTWDYWGLGPVTGWSAVVGTNIEFQNITHNETGNQYVELKAEPEGHYGIKQEVGTIRGATYLLMLDCRDRPAGKAWFAECPRMPSSLEVSPLQNPDRLFSPRIWRDPEAINTNMHPDAYYDMRSRMTPGEHAGQATFSSTGVLLLKGVSAGSADKMAAFPEHWSPYLHVDADVTPFVWALQLDGNPCDRMGTDTFLTPLPMLHEGAFLTKYLECRPAEPNAKPRFSPGGTP
ncbi:MAG: hypothetical protein WCP35_21705, partial [Verrucomicrobiota bacterium]